MILVFGFLQPKVWSGTAVAFLCIGWISAFLCKTCLMRPLSGSAVRWGRYCSPQPQSAAAIMHLRPNRKVLFYPPFLSIGRDLACNNTAYGLSSFPHLQQQGFLTFLVWKYLFISIDITPTNAVFPKASTKTVLHRECYVCSISYCVVYAACVTELCLGTPCVLRTICHAAPCPVITMATYSCALLQLQQPVRASWSAWQIDL